MFLYFEGGNREVLTSKDLYEQFMSDDNQDQRDNGTTFNEYVKDLIDRQIIYVEADCMNCGTENDFTFLCATVVSSSIAIIVVECNDCFDRLYL